MSGRVPATFAAWHRWDRNFFLAFVAACWLGVIMGFYPAVEARFTGRADYPASIVLQIHAIVFPAWLVLLTLQVALIRARHTELHRLLGLTSLAFIPVMTVTGFQAEVLAQRFYAPDDPLTQSFFIIPIFYSIAFPLLAGAAVWKRRDPPAHKRLMLLANATIVGAAYARWWGEAILSVAGDGFFGMLANTFAGFYLLVGAAILYDWLTRRRVHPAYVVTVPLIVAGQFGVSALYHAEAWRPVARAIAGI
ncbi:MAG: hypothetical protein ACK4P2_04630 [Hyphomonas sp.]